MESRRNSEAGELVCPLWLGWVVSTFAHLQALSGSLEGLGWGRSRPSFSLAINAPNIFMKLKCQLDLRLCQLTGKKGSGLVLQL
jgi:hypothetical protein